MATPPQLTQIAFGAPLDESTEDEILDPQIGFPVLENVRQDKRGGVSKRLGYAGLTTDRLSGSPRGRGRRLLDHRGTACIIDGTTLDTYDPAGTNIPRGRVPEVTVTTRALACSGRLDRTSQLDSVVCSGAIVCVWTVLAPGSGVAVHASVESASGVVIRPPELINVMGNPIIRLGTYGNIVVLIYAIQSSNHINFVTLDCTSAETIAEGWTNSSTLSTDKLSETNRLDVESLDDRIAIAYVNESEGTSQITIKTLNAAGVLETHTVNTSSITPNLVAIAGSLADTLWVAWNESDVLKAIGLDGDALTTTLAITGTLDTGLYFLSKPYIVAGPSPGEATLLVTKLDVLGSSLIVRGWTTTGGTVDPTHVQTSYNAQIDSRPFLRGNRRYALLGADHTGMGSTEEDLLVSVYLCDVTDHAVNTGARFRPVALAYPGLLKRVSYQPITLPDGRVGYAHVVASSSAGYAVHLVTYDWSDPANSRTAQHNGVTFISGGVLSYYDGQRVVETGILHPPSILDVTDTGSGTGPDGVVKYVATYEELDATGNWTISGVSSPTTVTTTDNALEIRIRPLSITARDPSRLRVVLWRTLPNEIIYYRAVDASLDILSSIVLVDDVSNAVLALRRRLYGTGFLPGTNGSALQRDAPPYCRDVVSYNGMLVIASGTDLWWSGQTIGGEGTWFSTEQFFLTVDGPGDITALAVQDNILYAFKKRSIYSISGDPPADNGSGGGLGQPRLLSSDVGCINTNSVVTTSIGVFFQSHRGIELLGRGAPVWIGEKVQRTLERFPIVTSAVLDARNSLVRFSLAAALDDDGSVVPYDAESGAGGGRDLVFDLVLGDWQSVDDKSGSSEHQPSQDACVITIDGKSKYAWLASDGTVYVEKDSKHHSPYRDPGGWITMTAETGWFKVGGLQGRQIFNRALLLARKHSPVNLSMSIGYTYREEYAEPREWTNDELNALLTSGWPITQLEHRGNNDSDGQSIRIRITDSSADFDGANGNGRGATWLGLTLDITPRSGAADVPEGAR